MSWDSFSVITSFMFLILSPSNTLFLSGADIYQTQTTLCADLYFSYAGLTEPCMERY